MLGLHDFQYPYSIQEKYNLKTVTTRKKLHGKYRFFDEFVLLLFFIYKVYKFLHYLFFIIYKRIEKTKLLHELWGTFFISYIKTSLPKNNEFSFKTTNLLLSLRMLIVVRQFNHEHWLIGTKFRQIGQLLYCTHIWTCSENDNYLDRTQCYDFQLKDVLSDTSPRADPGFWNGGWIFVIMSEKSNIF